MARPTKALADQLTKRGNFRLTETERQQLEQAAAAAGQSVSDYVRGLVVKAQPRRPTSTPERQTLIKALGQLGNIRADLNQLVKDRQAHHFVKPDDAEAVFKAITRIAEQIQIDLSGNGD